MELVIIRHGQSEMNSLTKDIKIYCGRYNTPLTNQGRKEASLLAVNPYVKKIEKVYASDLDRAIQTAILAKPNYEIEIRKEITERSLGIFEGKIVEEIKQKYPEYFAKRDLINFRFDRKAKAPKGENYEEVCQRAKKFMYSLNLEKNITIGVFSHMNFIRCLLFVLLRFPEKDIYKMKIDNCRVIVVKGETIGEFELITPKVEDLF